MVKRTHYKMQISKINEVYLKIEADSGVERELSDFFTFDVPGYRFMPAYRNKIWDGKIRLFSPATGRIYLGLLPYIKDFCYKNNIEYIIDKEVEDVREISKSTVKGFVRALKPKTQGKSLKVRDYQIDAIEYAIKSNRALLVSPTASGKSLIIYSLVRYYQMMKLKTLILVPTTSLVEQMYSDFEDYGWSSGTHCQKIYQGYTTQVTKDVVISTWQSIYKMPKKYFEQFGCVIGDEAHMFKAKSLTGIMTKLHLCKYRFGLTGTLDGTQTHRLVLEGLFGTVERVTTTKKLMESNHLAQLNIECIVLKHSKEECKNVKGLNYADEINYLVLCNARNNFITTFCSSLKGNTLCLFQLVEKHGAVLYKMMKDFDRKVFFVHGGTDTKTREEIRSITEDEKDAIIIASYGTFSTGINIRNIHNVVFASPSKSRIRVLQSIGRGLRRSESKDSIRLFDLSDDLSIKEHQNFTLRHFHARLNIYNQEEFNYKIDKVNI